MLRRKRVPLVELATKHGTKATVNGDGQSVIRSCAPDLEPLRDQPIRILEIGIKRGASLRLWEEAFPSAQIYALDIRKRKGFETDRTHVYVGDQADPVILEQIAADAGGFDVVIDDGSHLAPDQWTSLMTLWPHVTPGGVYIIEDVHTSYRWESYGMRYGQPDNTVGRLCSLVNDVYSSDHDQPVTLEGLTELRFCFRTALLHKRSIV